MGNDDVNFETAITVPENRHISNLIYTVRNTQVMLDSDLAELYQVETKVFNQAVKRNAVRFPDNFMFQLTDEEDNSLRSQIVTSKNQGRGGRRYKHYFLRNKVLQCFLEF